MEDDKSDNTEAVKAIRKLVSQHKIVAVLGSSGSGPSLAMAEFADKEGLPMISMAAADQVTNPVRPGIFKTPHTDVHGTKRIYKYLQEQGIKKIAILNDSNPYGSGWTQQLNKYAPEFGIVGINDGAPTQNQAPFGGMKESGIGREGGHHAMDEYLEIKFISFGL